MGFDIVLISRMHKNVHVLEVNSVNQASSEWKWVQDCPPIVPQVDAIKQQNVWSAGNHTSSNSVNEPEKTQQISPIVGGLTQPIAGVPGSLHKLYKPDSQKPAYYNQTVKRDPRQP